MSPAALTTRPTFPFRECVGCPYFHKDVQRCTCGDGGEEITPLFCPYSRDFDLEEDRHEF